MNEQSARLRALAEAQRENTTALRAAIQEALDAGMTWRVIGDALGMVHETVFRQFRAGSPIVVVKAYQSSAGTPPLPPQPCPVCGGNCGIACKKESEEIEFDQRVSDSINRLNLWADSAGYIKADMSRRRRAS